MSLIDPRFDPICDCGHSLRQHIGHRSLSPFATSPCSLGDCDCSDFRPVGEAGKDYEAGGDE